jgi:hypothetical protein
MTLELAYRNTFIDVTEESEMQSPPGRARARSSPPGPGQRSLSLGLEAAEEEDALRSYVGGLSQRADLIPKLQTGLETPPFPMLPSRGSLGHPEMCRRPCISFMAGRCENGSGCAYCHMEHSEQTPKLDKKHRIIIQGLGRAQMFELVRQLCHTKAEQAGFLDEAAEILDLLAQESQDTQPLAQPVSDRDLRNLHKKLARMKFSNLIGLVTNSGGTEAASIGQLMASLEKLRLQFSFRGLGQKAL